MKDEVKSISELISELKILRERVSALESEQISSKLIIENSTDAILITSQNGEIYSANSAACKMFGMTKEEICAKGRDAILDSNDKTLPEFPNAHELSDKVKGASTFIKKDGSKFIGEFTSTAFTDKHNNKRTSLIIRDVTEQKLAEEKLRMLSNHLHTVREEEKINLARELHDNIGQGLTGLKMDLVWMLKRLSKREDSISSKVIVEKVKTVIPIIDSLIQSIRQISANLRPNILDTLGLIPAIEWQLEELKKRTNIDYKFIHEADVTHLDQLGSTAVYRIIQELITNIIRHSEATLVVCRILEDEFYIIIRVEDNGKGISEEELSGINSLGIIGMQERAYLLGGELIFFTGKEKGTQVALVIPKKGKE